MENIFHESFCYFLMRCSGYSLLRDPHHNKGLAFTEKERDAHYLRGLLPPAIVTQQLQVATDVPFWDIFFCRVLKILLDNLFICDTRRRSWCRTSGSINFHYKNLLPWWNFRFLDLPFLIYFANNLFCVQLPEVKKIKPVAQPFS